VGRSITGCPTGVAPGRLKMVLSCKFDLSMYRVDPCGGKRYSGRRDYLFRSPWMALTAVVVVEVLCPAVSSAQQITASQVPVRVKAGVQATFPGVKVTEWKLKAKDYEAEFTLNKIDIVAKF
jgi:hypothetical protein